MVWLAVLFSGQAQVRPHYTLRWALKPAPPRFTVEGVSQKTLNQLQRLDWSAEEWRKLFSVHASEEAATNVASVPAMLGRYSVEEGMIQFQPQFPPDRGVSYRAVFRPAHLPGAAGSEVEVAFSFRLEPIAHESKTVVKQIYPSADELPELAIARSASTR